jgi:tRNA A-37 threonylcarbamoyl transferase component Bud32
MTSSNGINFAQLVGHAPPTWVYKQDRRSRVWQVDTPEGPVVFKRFQYSPPQQLIASTFGAHPGQREIKANARLREKGFPVVPILAHGRTLHPLGVRFWLVTPFVGKSVQRMYQEGDLEDPKRRKHVIDSISVLTSELIMHGFYNRDLKTSNLLMDGRGKLWMIDAGATRPSKNREQTLRMLAMLLKTLAQQEIPHAERMYLINAIRHRCEFLGPLDMLAKDIDAVRLPR